MKSDIRLIFLEHFEVEFVAGRIGDKKLMPETEILMLNSADLYEENRARVVYVANVNGITLRDVAEAFRNHLPKYGDHHFYEGMRYIGDYRKIVIYELWLGS